MATVPATTTDRSTTTHAAKLRQSCDRCHGQKLRCIRADDNAKLPCVRCQRLGAECVYSVSRPKGRPSNRRALACQSMVAQRPSPPVARGPATSSPSEDSWSGYRNGDSEATDDTFGQHSDLGLLSSFPHFPVEHEHALDLDNALNQLSEEEPLMPECSNDPFVPFPSPAFSKHSERTDQLLDFEYGMLVENAIVQSEVAEASTFAGSSKSAISTPISSLAVATDDDPRAQEILSAISQLSRLNASLCSLHRACASMDLSFVDCATGHLSGDDTLESVAFWLLGLDSMAECQPDVPDAPVPSELTVSRGLRESFAAARNLIRLLQGFDSALASHRLSNTVQEMVLMSHNLLLGIFGKVLAVVERQVEACKTSFHHTGVRFVLITQLCSYIVERQNEAVNMHALQNRTAPSASSSTDTLPLSDLHEPSPHAKRQVMETLGRLKRILKI